MRGSSDFPTTALCTVAALAAVYLLVPVPAWMAERGHWLGRALLHPLFHANIPHLAVNCIGAWTLLSRRDRRGWLSLLICVPLAVIGYAAALRPTIGFSNVLCAIMGMRTPPFRHGWWREKSTLVSLASLALLSLLPGVSATTHLASFALGVAFTRVWERVKGVGNG